VFSQQAKLSLFIRIFPFGLAHVETGELNGTGVFSFMGISATRISISIFFFSTTYTALDGTNGCEGKGHGSIGATGFFVSLVLWTGTKSWGVLVPFPRLSILHLSTPMSP
jgi:hypothetical protein